MTSQEAKAQSQVKMDKVQTLMRELQITTEAKQKVQPSGIIENVVVFIDHEKYDIDSKQSTPESFDEKPKSSEEDL